MRTLVLSLFLVACGGAVESNENRAPAGGEPVVAPTPAPPPAAKAPSEPAEPNPPAPTDPPVPGGDAKATRDGTPLYLSMCKKLDQKAGTLKIWGSITDPTFQVDEGIIALDVTPASARGKMTCGKDVRVVFAESRGAEFDADPNACSVQLATNAVGQVEGSVKAEYVDTFSGTRHAFTLDFTAGDCK